LPQAKGPRRKKLKPREQKPARERRRKEKPRWAPRRRGRNFKKEGSESHAERDRKREDSNGPQGSEGRIEKHGQEAGQSAMEKEMAGRETHHHHLRQATGLAQAGQWKYSVPQTSRAA